MINDTTKGFHGFGIAPGILEILKKLSFSIPTPIQEQAIPIAIEGKDVMGIERLIRIKMPISKLPELPAPIAGYKYKPEIEEERKPQRRGGGGQRGGQKRFHSAGKFSSSRNKFTSYKSRR